MPICVSSRSGSAKLGLVTMSLSLLEASISPRTFQSNCIFAEPFPPAPVCLRHLHLDQQPAPGPWPPLATQPCLSVPAPSLQGLCLLHPGDSVLHRLVPGRGIQRAHEIRT